MVNNFLKGKIVERFGSQSDFAQKIGASEQIVSRVVRVRKVLTEPEQQLWAHTLECEPEKIFTGVY